MRHDAGRGSLGQGAQRERRMPAHAQHLDVRMQSLLSAGGHNKERRKQTACCGARAAADCKPDLAWYRPPEPEPAAAKDDPEDLDTELSMGCTA